jgi:hypothetical protein
MYRCSSLYPLFGGLGRPVSGYGGERSRDAVWTVLSVEDHGFTAVEQNPVLDV